MAGRGDHRRSRRLAGRPQPAGRFRHLEPRVRAVRLVHGQHGVSRQDPLVPDHLAGRICCRSISSARDAPRSTSRSSTRRPTRSTTRCFASCSRRAALTTTAPSMTEVIADPATGLSGADIEAILARAVLVSDASRRRTGPTPSCQSRRAAQAFADFIPATSPLERELQILVAVQECTSREVLPDRYRTQEREGAPVAYQRIERAAGQFADSGRIQLARSPLFGLLRRALRIAAWSAARSPARRSVDEMLERACSRRRLPP